MPIRINGIPSVESQGSTAAAANLGSKIINPAPPETQSAGSLLSEALRQYEAAAVVIVDPKTRRVYATTTQAAGLMSAVSAAVPTASRLTPDAGQTGRSMTFTRSNHAGTPSQYNSALDTIVGATKPTYSVESLLARMFGVVPDGAENPPIFVIDQANARVVVYEGNTTQITAASAALAAVSLTGDSVRIGIGGTEAAVAVNFE